MSAVKTALSLPKRLFDEMEEEGYVVKTRKNRYGVPEKMNLVVGKLQGNPKGFGFLIPDDVRIEDIYVSGENMKEIADFISSKLSTLDQVQSTVTHFILKRYKQDNFIFEEPAQDKRLVVSP